MVLACVGDIEALKARIVEMGQRTFKTLEMGFGGETPSPLWQEGVLFLVRAIYVGCGCVRDFGTGMLQKADGVCGFGGLE